jgi:hypothetical protein
MWWESALVGRCDESACTEFIVHSTGCRLIEDIAVVYSEKAMD